jgi:hypothetical protein
MPWQAAEKVDQTIDFGWRSASQLVEKCSVRTVLKRRGFKPRR